MPNKLTDNEIVKALECCNKSDCKQCPYGKYNVAGWCCMPKVRKDALDLINRLQAENEGLKKLAQERHLHIHKLNVEIEQLRKIRYLKIKSKAYKECIEKVKEKYPITKNIAFSINPFALHKFLDNLLKELGKG